MLILAACTGALKPLEQSGVAAGEEGAQASPVLVRVATCWSGLPLAEDLAAAYALVAPDVSVDIMPSSSRVAASLAGAGQVDLAIVEQRPGSEAAPPADGDERKAGTPAVLALNTIGVIVPKDSPLSQLSSAELSTLFLGRYLDWEELQAGKGRIEIVSQEAGSAARNLFEERILGGSPTSSAAIVVPHDRGVLEYVAQHQGAIGYLSTSYVDERVKLMAIDGIPPQATEVERGRYPLVHPLVLLTAPHAPPAALRLAAFASSNKGRQAIAKRYVLPR
jgi:phosphate transport system substrate-binding protein